MAENIRIKENSIIVNANKKEINTIELTSVLEVENSTNGTEK